MAEAIARHLGAGRVEAYSAGLTPTGRVSGRAQRALELLDYPSHNLRSKSLDAIDLRSLDVIVSLIGEEGLRWLPRHLPATRLAWQVRDPYGEDEETFVSVARVLEKRIDDLLTDLGIAELTSS